MPREVTWILAATTGCAVSYVGGKYLLKDSLGEIKEVTTENLDEVLSGVQKKTDITTEKTHNVSPKEGLTYQEPSKKIKDVTVEKIDEVLKETEKKVSNELDQGGSKTKLNYITSNGLELEATSGRTTTILGTYKSDTGAIIDELGNVKSLDFGPRDGGFNLLNTPDELYVSPKQFWNEYNKPWLDNTISRNDIIKIVTEPTWNNLTRINNITGRIELTGFGREYTYLKSHGYVFDSVTKTMSR